MHDPDYGLISKVAGGDDAAFTQLVDKYKRRVLFTAYRYVGDASASEDLAQEVFIKVWQKAGSFKHKSLFSTWLYRIVVNHCLNYRAKQKRIKTVRLDEQIPDSSVGSEERLEKERQSRIVREAVSKLPKRQRMALILSRFEGKTYKEIAEVMGVSLSSVESLIFRAKDNLRRKLI